MILLVCGGRNFNDQKALDNAMAELPFTPSLIVQGGARGADTLAKNWAIKKGIHYAEVPALWNYHNRGAGHKRNSAMLLLNPCYCLALPGGPGTDNMKNQCIKSNIPVWEPYK